MIQIETNALINFAYSHSYRTDEENSIRIGTAKYDEEVFQFLQ